MDALKKKWSVNQPKLPDRISFLDSVQVDSAKTPGVGNYNVKVILFLSRIEQELNVVFLKYQPSLKI